LILDFAAFRSAKVSSQMAALFSLLRMSYRVGCMYAFPDFAATSGTSAGRIDCALRTCRYSGWVYIMALEIDHGRCQRTGLFQKGHLFLTAWFSVVFLLRRRVCGIQLRRGRLVNATHLWPNSAKREPVDRRCRPRGLHRQPTCLRTDQLLLAGEVWCLAAAGR